MAIKILSRDLLAQDKPIIAFPRDLRLNEHVRETRDQHIYEFIGTDNFGTEWNERRQYEVNAGRDNVPLLYGPIYREIRDANLPRNVSLQRIGPGGVVFEEVLEGGEVKFLSLGSSEATARIRHYGQGLEYSKDLVIFNELWSVPLVERQVGIAYNALLNHIHLSPILTATYTAANQTAAVSSGATTVEDYMLTLEAGITSARTDTTNPRRGPYVLLVSSANLFTVEKALTNVPQTGVSLQSRAIDSIQSIIAYDGWTGTRGNLTTTYGGVTSGKAYLVDTGNRDTDFISFMKQDLMQDGTQEDVSRFLTQVVWDCYFGMYASPLTSVEEITLP